MSGNPQSGGIGHQDNEYGGALQERMWAQTGLGSGRVVLDQHEAEAILDVLEAVATLPDSLSYAVDSKYWTGVPRTALAELRAKWEALNG